MLHSLALMDKDRLLTRVWERTCDMLLGCEDKKTGGFGGGPGQMAHLATTYAAINAFATLRNPEALKKIDRERLCKFLKSMKQADGSFTMHLGGEVDVRGVYCALTVAYLCNIQDLDLFDKTAEWVAKCQTYEGGFGPCPGNEAHGGYTYCAIASLVLLNKFDQINLKSLLRWLSSRQMPFEGGFSGRTNKMVDGCYSFWQGASFPLLHLILLKKC
jgi:protein farnesyltransferase subunit beta